MAFRARRLRLRKEAALARSDSPSGLSMLVPPTAPDATGDRGVRSPERLPGLFLAMAFGGGWWGRAAARARRAGGLLRGEAWPWLRRPARPNSGRGAPLPPASELDKADAWLLRKSHETGEEEGRAGLTGDVTGRGGRLPDSRRGCNSCLPAGRDGSCSPSKLGFFLLSAYKNIYTH